MLEVLFFFLNTCSMEYYMQKTYYKTASLISNSCKAIALLAGETAEVAMLAFEYGKNLVCDLLEFFLGIITSKILTYHFFAENHPTFYFYKIGP